MQLDPEDFIPRGTSLEKWVGVLDWRFLKMTLKGAERLTQMLISDP